MSFIYGRISGRVRNPFNVLNEITRQFIFFNIISILSTLTLLAELSGTASDLIQGSTSPASRRVRKVLKFSTENSSSILYLRPLASLAATTGLSPEINLGISLPVHKIHSVVLKKTGLDFRFKYISQ